MATQPDADGWIEWTGGTCPVSKTTVVDVKHADKTISSGVCAGDASDDDPQYGFDWWAHRDTLSNSHGFIIAYRVVQP